MLFLSGQQGFSDILPQLVKAYGMFPSDDMTNLLGAIKKADEIAKKS